MGCAFPIQQQIEMSGLSGALFRLVMSRLYFGL
jgi:hypothetical protein